MPAYEPMNAAELMDRVFDVYKKSFVKQLAFSALVGVSSFVIIMVISMAAVFTAVLPFLNDPENAIASILVSLLIVILPLYLIGHATANAGHILLSQQAFYGKEPQLPVKQLPGIVLRVLSTTLAQILFSLPWLLLMIFIAWLLLRAAGFTYWNDMLSLLFALSSRGWVLFGVAGTLGYVLYSNWFALSVPVAVFEKQYFFQTIFRSGRLMKGDFWPILGLRVLWSIVVYLFTYSAQGMWMLLATLVSAISGGVSGGISGVVNGGGVLGASFFIDTLATMLQYFFTVAIGFVLGPLGGILTALLYFNQRIKREALDIEIALDGLTRRSHDRL